MAQKKYANVDVYEKKLKRTMERMGISEFEYNWDRKSAFVIFQYKSQKYKFEHNTEKASASGKTKIIYGTDVFAQLVLAMEDLARMIERGIYDLPVWCEGMKLLPQKITLPECFTILGFPEQAEHFPAQEEIDRLFKQRVKETHPDNNGNINEYYAIHEAYHNCIDMIEDK